MRATVPRSRVDNSYEALPQGLYTGDIGEAEVRDPMEDGSWLTLRLSTTDVRSEDGEVERSRFQDDLTIETDGIHITEVADFSDDNVPFGLVRTAGLLAGLGEALGVGVERDGTDVIFDPEPIIEALQDGAFEGERVAFEVDHWTRNEGEPDERVEDQYARFGPAA